MRIFACALLAAVSCLAQTAGISTDDWRFAHPNADLLASVSPIALLGSPVGALLAAQLTGSSPREGKVRLDLVRGLSRSISRIAVSAVAGDPQNDVLVMLAGDFDDDARKTLLATPLFRASRSSVAKQIRPDLILIGEPASIAAAVTRMSAPAQAQARMSVLPDGDLWISGIPSVLGSGSSFLKSVNSFTLKSNLQVQTSFDLVLNTASEQNADEILEYVRKGYGLIVSRVSVRPQIGAAVAQALRYRKTGEQLRLHLEAPSFLMELGLSQVARMSEEVAAVLEPLFWKVLGMNPPVGERRAGPGQ